MLPQVAGWLAAGHEGGMLDLSEVMVVVPAAEAGRRLREVLAQGAAERGGAMLPPRIVTPEAVVSRGSGEEVAERAGELACWMETMRTLTLEECRAVFPADPPKRDQAWALGAAAELLRLRHQLDEGGLDFAGAAERLGSGHEEAMRWRELAGIEMKAVSRMESAGMVDPHRERMDAAEMGRLPEGVSKVVVAAVPDVSPLLAMALGAMERNGIAVTVLVHSNGGERDRFDEWGRPVVERWVASEIALRDAEEGIRVFARPQEAARYLAEEWVRAEGEGGLAGAVGSADPEVTAAFLEAAETEGLAVYDPAGRPLGVHALHWTLQVLRDLIRHDSMVAAGGLLRMPEVFGLIPESAGALRVRRAWDEFVRVRLPSSVGAALVLAEAVAEREAAREEVSEGSVKSGEPALVLLPALRWLVALREEMRGAGECGALLGFLGRLYERGGDVEFGAAARAIVEGVMATDGAFVRAGLGGGMAERLDFLLELLRGVRVYGPRPDGARAVVGWLEVPWLDDADLYVAGCNEGMLPDSLAGDAWLPDGARTALGLRNNATRLARDSFLLTAMQAVRAETGRLVLMVCRFSAGGEPLKPGRLLFRCRAEELPERAMRLFGESEESGPGVRPSWHRGWRLRVPGPRPDDKLFERISVTQFGDYLRCPLRFYLKHGLQMQEFDGRPAELDARGYGNVVHEVIERLHRTPGVNGTVDRREVEAFLEGALREVFERLCGGALTVPLRMQLETARRRLGAFARVHAEERAKGWRTKLVEARFPELREGSEPVRIEGVEIKGRIDLIEEHVGTGALRIIDYKTGKTTQAPIKHHLRGVKPGEVLEAWRTVEVDGKEYAWTNLQLAYYAGVVSRIFGVDDVGAAYIAITPAVQDSGLHEFEGLTAEVCAAAERCAAGIVRSIRAGVFWPPSERVKYDDFRVLARDGAMAAFDPELLEKFRETLT